MCSLSGLHVSRDKYAFMKIKFFISNADNIWQVVGEVLRVRSFAEHVYSYHVGHGNDEIINVIEIVDFQRLGVYTFNSKMFIPRHHVVGLRERLQMFPLPIVPA